jgi:hypothetical protein
MAMAADREYRTMNPTEELDILAGAADILYKGAIVSAGADGFIKVAGDVAADCPLGLCKEQVVAAGANIEHVIIETGRFLIPKVSLQTTTVLFTDQSGGGNAAYANKFFYIFNGTTRYHVWFNVAGAGVDPAPAGSLPLEVPLAVGDNDAAVAAAVVAVVNPHAAFTAGAVGATVTIRPVTRGACTPSADGDCGAIITLATTVNGTVRQADVGQLFYCNDDDGVVYLAECALSVVALGACGGIDVATNSLWIDTRIKQYN